MCLRYYNLFNVTECLELSSSCRINFFLNNKSDQQGLLEPDRIHKTFARKLQELLERALN